MCARNLSVSESFTWSASVNKVLSPEIHFDDFLYTNLMLLNKLHSQMFFLVNWLSPNGTGKLCDV